MPAKLIIIIIIKPVWPGPIDLMGGLGSDFNG